ncbi:MAG: hypothetical protein PHE15_05945 [Dehalococcoidales bacterium]|nr:hypothetical protein [Dehalococcoidales bacterium]
MKKLFAGLSWLGLLLLVASLPLSFSSSYTKISTGELGSGVGYAVTNFAAIIALIFALIGGIIAKPRYLWFGVAVVGILHVASFYGYYVEPNHETWEILLALLPGILLMIEGTFLKLIEQRRSLVLRNLVIVGLNVKPIEKRGYSVITL